MRVSRLAIAGLLLAAIELTVSHRVFAHGQPVSLAFYGKNFSDSDSRCQQAVGRAARTCFNRVINVERHCMESEMAGVPCDATQRDATIESAKRTARAQVAANCDPVALGILQFLSLDEAQTDIVNACDVQSAAALSVMYGPTGGAASVGQPSSSDPCMIEAAHLAHKYIRAALRGRQRALDSMARKDVQPSVKLARMAGVTARLAHLRDLVKAKLQAVCGDQFPNVFGKSPDAFLDLSEARASCVTAAGYVQGEVTCPQPVCGNGAKEAGEECDDGNAIDDDACHNNCTKTSCNFFPTTYQLIQAAVFESKGCTNDACHGSLKSGGLDLRRPVSYHNLVDVASLASPLKRVEPGDKDRSLLFRKLAAATLNNIPDLEGGPMPSGGLPALSQNELEAIRLWIHNGAPETGVVLGVADLLDACAPPANPIAIRPPDAPEPGKGVQLHMPAVPLKAKSETEVCFASYYDFTGLVPPESRTEYGTFRFKKRVETQDPLSHHLIIHIYRGSADTSDPGWGSWTCKGGPSAGQSCDPKAPTDCAAPGICGSDPQVAVACLGYGPSDYSETTAPAFGGSQQTLNVADFAPGVFEELPLKGIIVWNSHAFNLTQQAGKVEAWVNFDFATPPEQLYPVQGGILDPDGKIFIMNVPAFEKKQYCWNYTFDRGARVFELSSHMHKRGKLFQIYAPNGDLIYNSTQYNDPIHLAYKPPLALDGEADASRTFRYCAEYDNGATNPSEVKRKSTSPIPPNGVPIGGPCQTPTHCTEGLAGQPCHGTGQLARDRSCDTSNGAGDGRCDACPLRGGVTTEDEMFLFLATYYCDPAFPDTCKTYYDPAGN